MKRNPIFKHYYANLPEVWTFWEPRENDPQPVDINGKGREIVKNLSGFDTSLRLSEEEKNQYFRKLGHFSKFLEKTVDSLIKSLNS